jgi:hypothetical protein
MVAGGTALGIWIKSSWLAAPPDTGRADTTPRTDDTKPKNDDTKPKNDDTRPNNDDTKPKKDRDAKTDGTTTNPDPMRDPLVLVVSPRGDGDHTRIGDALKHVRSGGVIKIRPGMYDEALVVAVEATLEGDGPREQITVRGTGAPAVTLAHPRAVVRNLTLWGRKDGTTAEPAVRSTRGGVLERCEVRAEAVACVVAEGTASRPTLRECVLRDAPVGVLIRKEAHPTLEGCRFTGGTTQGVLADGPCRGTLTNCTFLGQKGAAVEIKGTGRLKLTRCRLADGEGFGLTVAGGTAELEDCTVGNNGETGLWIEAGATLLLKGGEVRDNRGWGLRALGASKVEESGCKFEGNDRGSWECEKGCKWNGGPPPRSR